MKKISLLFTLFILVHSYAVAFDVTVGVKGGGYFQVPLGYYYLKDQMELLDAIDPNHDIGLNFNVKGQIGFFVELHLNEHFSLKPEMFYGINNGFSGWAKFTETSNIPMLAGQKVTIKEGFYSIDFDFLFNGRFPINQLFTVTLGSGPSIIIPVGSFYKTNPITQEPSVSSKLPVSAIFGLLLEVGFEFDFKQYGVFATSYRSDWSLTPVYPRSNRHNSGYWHRPAGLFISYGYRFIDNKKGAD